MMIDDNPVEEDGVRALCFCHCMPPEPAKIWIHDPDSPKFGVTPVMLPPPHDVVIWAVDQHDPHRIAPGRVNVYIARGRTDHNSDNLALKPAEAKRLAERLFEAAEMAATDRGED